MDPFIPHAFVSRNRIWNLIPLGTVFNSNMSDKKPVLDQFFDPFLKIQQNAVEIIHYKTPKNKYFGDYLTIFANFNAGPLNREKFLEQVVPLVTIASNNGFEFL